MIAKTKEFSPLTRHLERRSRGPIHHAPPAFERQALAESEAPSAERCFLIGDHSGEHFVNALPAHIFSRMVDLDQFRCLAPVSDVPAAPGAFPRRSWADAAADLRSTNLPAVFLGQQDPFQTLASAYESSVTPEEAERFSLLQEISSARITAEYLLRKTGRSSHLANFGSEFTHHRFLHISLRGWPKLSACDQNLIKNSLQASGPIGAADHFTQDLAQELEIDSIPMPSLLYLLEQTCPHSLAGASQASAGIASFRHRFPTGWAAVEIASAEKANITAAITAAEQIISSTGLGVVFFSPKLQELTFHEEKALKRAVSAFTGSEAARFVENDLWAQVNFLRQSRLVISETTNTRILSAALSLPRLSRVPQNESDQDSLVDFCETWERVDVEMLAEENPESLLEQLGDVYQKPFSHWETEAVQQYAASQWLALDI